MSITDAVIPVAGLGTRLLPATRSQPKEMLPVLDKPVVQYVVEELAQAGIDRVLFVTGRRKRAIEDHFDADPELELALAPDQITDPGGGLQMLYTRQPRPAGLGDALRHAAGFAPSGGVVVALGDTIISGPGPGPGPGTGRSIVTRLMDAYELAGASAAIAVEEVPAEAVSRYGIVVPADTQQGNDQFEVTEVIEKPEPGAVRSRMAVAARYVLGPDVFAALRDTGADASGEVQLADALRTMIDRGARVVAVPLQTGERRHDIGTVEGYCATFLEYALRDPRLGARLRERAAELLRDVV